MDTNFQSAMTITIVDLNLNNLWSLKGALEHVGARLEITSDVNIIRKAQKLILPGLGSFSEGMSKIVDLGLYDVLRKKILNEKVFTLGICLGFQLLFQKSTELKNTEGLKIFQGKVQKFSEVKEFNEVIPHVGFNTVHVSRGGSLFANLSLNPVFYFTHSYAVNSAEGISFTHKTLHGIEFVSAIEHQNIWGTQFHPEKSQQNGLKLLKNFVAAH